MFDNLLAFRVLYLLTKPWKETEAYTHGIIDENGKELRKFKALKNSAERKSYSMLHRLVFRLRRLLEKLPGGNTRIANLAAAYFLVKEHKVDGDLISNEELAYKLSYFSNKFLIEEVHELVSVANLLKEDVPANVSGEGVSTDIPVPLSKPLRRRKKEKKDATT